MLPDFGINGAAIKLLQPENAREQIVLTVFGIVMLLTLEA